jgi:hypothetical protein
MKTSYAIGIGIAVVLVITLAVAGFQAAQNTPSQTSTTLSTSQRPTSSQSQSSGASSTGEGPTSSTQQGGSRTSSAQSANSGDFAMMATDPPVAASGVSSATVTYNGLAVHSAGSASASGWTEINGSGTINLMSSANVSQTIASSQVQSGTYDMVAMNVTSGAVVYNGQTYNAAIASGNIKVHLNSDVQVNSTTSSAAIIDLRTFVINAGNASSPQFVISASAKATSVPPSDVTTASLQVGATSSLKGQAWWTGFQDQTATDIGITSATLTSNSLTLKVSNSGNASGDVQTIVVTPVSASGTFSASLPSSLSGSAVFTVGSDGSVQASNAVQGAILLNATGTAVSSDSSTTLNFSGNISLNFGLGALQLSGVIAGQSYLVTVMGANTFANIVVVAQ